MKYATLQNCKSVLWKLMAGGGGINAGGGLFLSSLNTEEHIADPIMSSEVNPQSWKTRE